MVGEFIVETHLDLEKGHSLGYIQYGLLRFYTLKQDYIFTTSMCYLHMSEFVVNKYYGQG